MKYNYILGQSAIEYLMTYGWMLLVVAVVGGAIFSVVGDQSIESVSGFDGSDIIVSDFGSTPASLQMVVEGGSQSVTLEEIRVSDADERIEIPVTQEIGLREAKTINLPHLTETEGTNEIQIELTYSVGNLENITNSGTVTGSLEVDRSLVGYWPLTPAQANETHIFDVSGHNNSGERFGTEFIEDDEKGRVLSFSGEGDQIRITESEEWVFDIDDNFTFSTWIYIKPHPEHGDSDEYRWSILAREGDSGWSGTDYGLVARHPEHMSMVVGTEEGSNRDNFASPEMGEWHHLAGVKQGDEIIAYFNGEQTGQEDIEGEELRDRHDLTISQEWSRDSTLNGMISDAMIYDRALTENEIQSLSQNSGLIQ